MKDLDKEYEKLEKDCCNHKCECENCGKFPLKHYERCPFCGSESFHIHSLKAISHETSEMNGN